MIMPLELFLLAGWLFFCINCTSPIRPNNAMKENDDAMTNCIDASPYST